MPLVCHPTGSQRPALSLRFSRPHLLQAVEERVLSNDPPSCSRPRNLPGTVFERLAFRKVELWVVGLICVAAFVGVILVRSIARKAAEGTERFGLVGEAALALSKAPEKLMRAGRLLIGGASISVLSTPAA